MSEEIKITTPLDESIVLKLKAGDSVKITEISIPVGMLPTRDYMS